MTDQPTKGPFKVHRDSYTTVVFDADSVGLARFLGPDREANAKLFIDASDWEARALAAEAEVAALRENIQMLERIAHRWNNP